MCCQLRPRLPYLLRLEQCPPDLPPRCLHALRPAPRSEALLVLADLVPKTLNDLAGAQDLSIKTGHSCLLEDPSARSRFRDLQNVSERVQLLDRILVDVGGTCAALEALETRRARSAAVTMSPNAPKVNPKNIVQKSRVCSEIHVSNFKSRIGQISPTMFESWGYRTRCTHNLTDLNQQLTSRMQ